MNCWQRLLLGLWMTWGLGSVAAALIAWVSSGFNPLFLLTGLVWFVASFLASLAWSIIQCNRWRG